MPVVLTQSSRRQTGTAAVNRCGRARRMTSTPLHQPGLPLLCAVRHSPSPTVNGAPRPDAGHQRHHRHRRHPPPRHEADSSGNTAAPPRASRRRATAASEADLDPNDGPTPFAPLSRFRPSPHMLSNACSLPPPTSRTHASLRGRLRRAGRLALELATLGELGVDQRRPPTLIPLSASPPTRCPRTWPVSSPAAPRRSIPARPACVAADERQRDARSHPGTHSRSP
jgi:hypothetical protein